MTDEQVRCALYTLGYGPVEQDKKPLPKGADPHEFLAKLKDGKPAAPAKKGKAKK